MNRQQSPTSSVEHSNSSVRGESETRLHVRWLLLARGSWILLLLLVLTLNLVMIPSYDAVLQARCHPGPQCFAISLSTSDRQLLHQFGLSPGFLAAYQVGLDVVSVLVCCALGALIFWRKSADRMALFCAFTLVLFGGAGFTNILQEALAPLSAAWFVLVGTLDVLGQTSFLIFFLLFPSGKFVPRWTRWIAILVFLYWLYTIFLSNSFYSQSSWSNLVFFAFLLCIVGAQVYRYRYVSTSRERQQTKWVVFGFSIGILGFVLAVVLGNLSLAPALDQSGVVKTLVGGTIIYGFLLLIPLSIALAILRSRLWDIDVLINRTLVYGLLTAILLGVYLGLVFAGQALLSSLLGPNNAVVLVGSTLIVAALFQPLRQRIQQVIDSRFYRRKYDAVRTLAAFSATLRAEVDLATLSEHLVAVVQETMQPSHVSLWLRQPSQIEIPSAQTGEPAPQEPRGCDKRTEHGV